jgi:hypothetical protein
MSPVKVCSELIDRWNQPLLFTVCCSFLLGVLLTLFLHCIFSHKEL